MRLVTREEFKAALDEHKLWVKENWNDGPRWYLARRNGRTKTWSRDKKRWRTPIKWKLKTCFSISDTNIEEMSQYFRIGYANVRKEKANVD